MVPTDELTFDRKVNLPMVNLRLRKSANFIVIFNMTTFEFKMNNVIIVK